MDKNKLVFLLLRIGLSFVFIYAAFSSLINPINWIGYFPQFLKDIVPPSILLPSLSAFEIILGIWVLSGRRLFYSSLISAFSLLGIIVFNFNQMDIVFRDVSILLTAIALAVYSYEGFPWKKLK